ncbi:hypothetical protein L226DRAFT_204682 [Lentinus tigrinus ALCF2SS1-7]|nr:hypothetical protein L226DRAFT_204682 [Lentinus tigrinus ALCF2SS1-7]
MYHHPRNGSYPRAAGQYYAPPAPPAGHFHLTPRPSRHRPRLTITNFPNELLIKIFAELGLAYDLFLPMRVCREWRNIIRYTPEFWRNIRFNRNQEWPILCLERSQQLLVDIFVFFSAIPLSHVLHILRPHKDRIALLKLHDLDCGQVRDYVSLGNMRHLKSLEVNVLHNHAAGHHGICPPLLLTSSRLERLDVIGLTVQGPSPTVFSTLRELRIVGHVGARRTHDLSQFLNMLQACASLEGLRLLNRSLDAINFDLPQYSRFVALPRLRELTIKGKVRLVSHMVSHLEVGPKVAIWLIAECEEVEDVRRAAVALRALLPSDLQRCRLPILRTANRVKVDMADGPEEVLFITATRGENPDEKIELSLEFTREVWANRARDDQGPVSPRARKRYFLGALRCLPTMFPGARVETLVVHGDVEFVDAATWRSLFVSISYLKILVISASFDNNTSPAFVALVSPWSRTDPSPLCRHLEYIWIRHSRTLDHLEKARRCIAWRNASGAPVKRLCLDLFAHPTSAAPVPDVSKYRAEFARLVPDSSVVEVEVHGPWKGDIDVTEAEFPFGSLIDWSDDDSSGDDMDEDDWDEDA